MWRVVGKRGPAHGLARNGDVHAHGTARTGFTHKSQRPEAGSCSAVGPWMAPLSQKPFRGPRLKPCGIVCEHGSNAMSVCSAVGEVVAGHRWLQSHASSPPHLCQEQQFNKRTTHTDKSSARFRVCAQGCGGCQNVRYMEAKPKHAHAPAARATALQQSERQRGGRCCWSGSAGARSCWL